MPRALTEHELAVLSEIAGQELSEAELAETRVLELANGRFGSWVGREIQDVRPWRRFREVMENLAESTGDKDKDEVGSLPNNQMHRDNKRKKDFQDLIGRLRSELSCPEVARLMAKTDPGMMPSEYLQRMEALVARFEDCFRPDFTISDGMDGKRHVVRIKLGPDAISVSRKPFRLLREHTLLVQAWV